MKLLSKKISLSTHLWALLFTFPLSGATSISDNQAYPKFCMKAATKPRTFAQFKRSPIYNSILEHLTFQQGQQYLDVILRESPECIPLFDKFRANDAIGAPFVYNYAQAGIFSPTTLRYIKVASDLKRLFGSLDNLRIIEIGGGYGGQCTVLSKLFKWANYTIVDLPGPLALTRKYLKAQQVPNVTLLAQNELPALGEYDLVISNYALTECNTQVQDSYINTVLSRSKRGYITGNFIGADFQVTVHSKDALLSRLKAANISCTIAPETPSTFAGNYLLTWGQ